MKPSEHIRKRAIELAGLAYDQLVEAGGKPEDQTGRPLDRNAYVRHFTPWRLQEAICDFIDQHLEGVWEDGKRIYEVDLDRDICLGYPMRQLRDALAFALTNGWKPTDEHPRSA